MPYSTQRRRVENSPESLLARMLQGAQTSNPVQGLISSLGANRGQSIQPPKNNIEELLNPLSLIGQPPQEEESVDYVEEFLKSMAANIGQEGTGLNQADYEEALRNSAAQIKGAFGAEIGAVRASSANARHQTKRSKKQIKAMYNALGRQYKKGAKQEVAQGKDIAQALQNVTNQASGNVKGTSDQLLNEQAALAEGLGVQAALPDIAAKQQAQVAQQVGNIQQTGARNASDALSNSGSQQRFLVRGGKNALLEGTNRRADLVQQLQAFLQENMGKIADIKSRRGQALAANEQGITKSFSEGAGDAANDSWNRQKDLATLLLSLRGQNQQGSGEQKSPLPSWAQQSGQILQGTSNPSEIGGVIQELLGNKDVIKQQYRENHKDLQMNPGKFVDMLVQQMRAQGYNPDDIALAKIAALQQYQGIY